MRQGMFKICFLMVSFILTVNVYAQGDEHESLVPSFKLQKNDSFLNPQLSSTLNADRAGSINRATGQESLLRSYDAIFYYPMHRSGMSFDLGVNVRLMEDPNQASQPGSSEQDWLSIDPSEARTRVHAAAVFDLPFKGLKAGVSGSYDPALNGNADYDYEARLSYKWRNGFGLQGGWQHQQKPLEQQNLNDTLDVQTLFLDLNYNF